ncbi:MAG: hypothetical protein RI911_180 [Candidatus Parcubacteria bacterium]|jgi:ADP-ribose pyrophosphatase YjhB (NUDIX family)
MQEKIYIDKIAFLEIQDRKVLETKTKGRDVWYIPGGKPEAGENHHETLIRELKEELSIDIILESIEACGVFEAVAHGKPEGTYVRMHCYKALYRGTLQPSSEIEAYDWFDMSRINETSPVDKVIFKSLSAQGLID